MKLFRWILFGLVGIWGFTSFPNSASAKMTDRLKSLHDDIEKADESTAKEIEAYYPENHKKSGTVLAQWGWTNWNNWGNWGNWDNWRNWSDFDNYNWQKFRNF